MGQGMTPEERDVLEAAKAFEKASVPEWTPQADVEWERLIEAVRVLNVAASYDFIAAVRELSPRAANSLVREGLNAEKLAALEWPQGGGHPLRRPGRMGGMGDRAGGGEDSRGLDCQIGQI